MTTPPGSQGRTFESPAQAVRKLTAVARSAPRLWFVYRGGLPPKLRERIIVGVSEANACAGCTRVHQRWAVRTGVSEDDLEALGLGDLARLDERSRAAVVYAVERSQQNFAGSVDPEVKRAVTQHFGADAIEGIDAVARGIDSANLSVSGVGALRRRLGL